MAGQRNPPGNFTRQKYLMMNDECTEAADLIISGAYRSYASVLNAFRLKALEDVAQSILDKFLES